MSLCKVVCAGIPRSGSTWAYNVALTLSSGMGRTAGIYSDLLISDWTGPGTTENIVLKTHSPDEGLSSLILSGNKPVIFSVREPRDCVCSLMSQFKFSFDQAAEAMISSISKLNNLAQSERSVIIRYESPGARSEKSILKIASLIGAMCTSEEADALARSLKRTVIKRKIEELQRSGVIDPARPSESYEPTTHWHPNHIGDGAVGKYVEVLTAKQSEAIYDATQEFCFRHGYPN